MEFFVKDPADRSPVVRTTVGSRADAEAMAKRLVESRVTACVHVSEITSVYRWKGKVETHEEFLVEARTHLGARDRLRAAMAQGHPYELPLLEVVEPSVVNRDYMAWLRSEAP